MRAFFAFLALGVTALVLMGQVVVVPPTPTILPGTISNLQLAPMGVGTVKCRSWGAGSTGTPQDCVKDWVSAQDFSASGSNQTTTGTINTGTAALSLTAPIDFVNGQGIAVHHAGATFTASPPTAATATPTGGTGATTYTYTIASVDAAGGIGAAIANFTTTTGVATLSVTQYNLLSWTGGTGAAGYAIYGRIGGSLTLIGFVGNTTNQFADQGQATPITPAWIPSTPPGAALSDWLLTTIVSGAGTTNLTLNANATTTATTQGVAHDDSQSINAAITFLNSNSGGTVWLGAPAGQYNLFAPIALPINRAIGLIGAGRGDSSGTRLMAQGALVGMITTGTSFVRGYRVSNLTLDGQAMAQFNILISQLDDSTFDNLNVLNATNVNILAGNGSTNTQELVFYAIKIDNSLNVFGQGKPGTVNLPKFNLDVQSSNSDYISIKAANAQITNVLSDTAAAGNKYIAVHGYNFYGATQQAPQQNFQIAGNDEQIIACEADGSQNQNIIVSKSNNSVIGCFSQFQGITAQQGLVFSNTSSNNVASGNVFLNSTAANSIVDGGGNNQWNGNIASTPGVTLGHQWLGYTPAPSCGTATFTVNTARYKQNGKDVFINLDVTITAVGTCTNSISFTVPVIPTASNALSGFDIGNSGKGAVCYLPAGGATASPCRIVDLTNWSTNGRLVVNGVYESQ